MAIRSTQHHVFMSQAVGSRDLQPRRQANDVRDFLPFFPHQLCCSRRHRGAIDVSVLMCALFVSDMFSPFLAFVSLFTVFSNIDGTTSVAHYGSKHSKDRLCVTRRNGRSPTISSAEAAGRSITCLWTLVAVVTVGNPYHVPLLSKVKF